MPRGLSTKWTIIGEPFFTGTMIKVRCRCECGTERDVRRDAVVYGQSKSCGKCVAGKHLITHGRSGTPEYIAYHAILQRCNNPNYDAYRLYGARGIKVCARWLESVSAFLDDVGTRPTEEHSIDRIDNDKGYWCGKPECPECGPAAREPNWRWGTDEVQNRNRSNNRMITHDGETQCLQYWADKYGIRSNVLGARLNMGWTFEEAVTRPVAAHVRRNKPSADSQ